MEGLMTLQFPLKREIMTAVRLATGGVCSLAGLSLDGSEDCKVCVTESLLLILRRGYTDARVTFGKENGIKIVIEGSGQSEKEKQTTEEEISIALLNALVDHLEITCEDGVCRVSFGFGV